MVHSLLFLVFFFLPRFLFGVRIDEPLDGLDPLGRLDFKRLILDLKKTGKTVFFSSHILADVAELCDRVAIIHKGKVIAVGSPTELIGKQAKTLEEVFVERVSS